MEMSFRNTGNALRIVNINVNSIKSTEKRVLFHAFLDDVSPAIVIGTESKLDGTYKNCEIFPPGYRSNVIRRDRNSHGGGVFIVAKDEINITEIDVANTECPLVLAKITVKDGANITIGAFYRQPTSVSAGSKTRGARSKLVGMGPHHLTYHSMTFSHHLSVVSCLGRVDVLNHFEPALSVCCPLWAYLVLFHDYEVK